MEVKDDPKFFILQIDQDEVEHWLSIIAWNYKRTNSLIIFDDCASSQSVKNRTSASVNFVFHGQHAGFLMVVIAQQCTAIRPAFCLNAQHVLIFYTLDETDWGVVSNKFLSQWHKRKKMKFIKH